MAEWYLVALAFLTLVVFIRYAYDTYRIAKVSVSQTENSQMPFLAIAMKEGAPPDGGWVIQNQGFGPAVNIFYGDRASGALSRRSLPGLKVGAERLLNSEIVHGLSYGAFEMEYESLSGLKYRTVFRIVNGEQNTDFQKPR